MPRVAIVGGGITGLAAAWELSAVDGFDIVVFEREQRFGGKIRTSPFAGRKMTGLSNREELLNRFAKKAPWLLEDRLKQSGVRYSKALLPLRPHIVVDGNLYSGQNPQSSHKLAERLVTDMSAK